MFRRTFILLLTCIALIGMAPSRACATQSPQDDCCAPGQSAPCAPQKSLQVDAAACCVSIAQQASALVAPREESTQKVASFGTAGAPISDMSTSVRALTYERAERRSEGLLADDSLIYLKTGRLRL